MENNFEGLRHIYSANSGALKGEEKAPQIMSIRLAVLNVLRNVLATILHIDTPTLDLKFPWLSFFNAETEAQGQSKKILTIGMEELSDDGTYSATIFVNDTLIAAKIFLHRERISKALEDSEQLRLKNVTKMQITWSYDEKI